MSRDKLSKRQMAIYDYICSYTKERGFPPSVREIGSAVGLASPSTVHMHLKVLQEHGLIRRDSKKPRTIEVVNSDADQGSRLASVIQDPNNNVITLPIVGHV
ncbi:MAG: helix-turn-helix domain-containing protein, partial [Atopobiaceae bacterium]|nr:helix-turn-helix domain-containing protein [Atopobiaceae bacterium]